MNTRAAGRGTTTAGIAVTTDAVTTVAAAGERGRQGTRRGVIYQPGYTLTKSATFPENRTTSVSRLLTGSSTVPFHRGGRCFVRLPVSRSLTGSSTVPVHREGGSRQRMSGPSTMSHPALWTCPACGRPLTVALNPEGGEAGAHRPLEISRASAAAHACTPAARFPQFHSASSSSSITGYEPASCQPWQPPVSAGAEDDEGVISQSEYTLTKPSSCPNHRDHVTERTPRPFLPAHRNWDARFGRRRWRKLESPRSADAPIELNIDLSGIRVPLDMTDSADPPAHRSIDLYMLEPYVVAETLKKPAATVSPGARNDEWRDFAASRNQAACDLNQPSSCRKAGSPLGRVQVLARGSPAFSARGLSDRRCASFAPRSPCLASGPLGASVIPRPAVPVARSCHDHPATGLANIISIIASRAPLVWSIGCAGRRRAVVGHPASSGWLRPAVRNRWRASTWRPSCTPMSSWCST